MITQGLGPNALGSQAAAALVDFPNETYQTPLLDITKTYANIELVPARPGHFPLMVASRWLVESHSGTMVGSPTFNAGNNATHDNFVASTNISPDPTEVNTGVPPSISSGIVAPAVTLKRFTNAPVLFDMTLPGTGTGGFALQAKFVVLVQWIAVGGA